jgi:putative transposase
MIKAYKYRAYCNVTTETNLKRWMKICKYVWNCSLELKEMLYKQWRVSMPIRSALNHGIEGINSQLAQAKKESELQWIAEVNSEVLLNLTDRLAKAYDAFFRRVKEGAGESGYPHFKREVTSLTFGKSGWKLKDNKLELSKVGRLKIKLHRPIQGDIKTVTVSQDALKHWYVCFSCDNVPEVIIENRKAIVGIDMNVSNFLTDSENNVVDNPRRMREMEAKKEWLKEEIKNSPKGSARRKKLSKKLGKLSAQYAQKRDYFLHNVSRQYVNQYEKICVENLSISNMTRKPKPKPGEKPGEFLPNGAAAKGGLNKSINDCAWGKFFEMLKYKLKESGGELKKVDPRNTSQMCSQCGCIVKKDLAQRWHSCPECGFEAARDHNAALNILRKGSQ